METANDYHVNMFKMKSPYARANARLIITMIIVWFTAVIGFQILLKVVEKQVPEKSFLTFRELQPKMIAGNATLEERASYAKSILMVLAKNPAKNDKAQLMENFHYALMGIVPREVLFSGNRDQLVAVMAPKMGVELNSLEMQFLPYMINSSVNPNLNPNAEKVMAKYLIHNRSFLTDTRFLGFPFHYWYTAEFLLILFVFLCWLYCMRINTLQKKFNVTD